MPIRTSPATRARLVFAASSRSTVACVDFHRHEHLATWKTLLPCEKNEPAVVDYLRSSQPSYITRLELGASARAGA